MNTSLICIDANFLKKKDVRSFHNALNAITPTTDNFSDDNENFEGNGVALMLGPELRGLYTSKKFEGLHPDTTMFYPFGGVVAEDRYTPIHTMLVSALLDRLKTEHKTQVIISLERQPIEEINHLPEEESFWLAHGFSQLDVQVHYQGDIKYDKTLDWDNLKFCVSLYLGGDSAIETELCQLHRQAYKRRIGVPDLTTHMIRQHLTLPGCVYLITRHEEDLIGMVTLYIYEKECYVDSIHIKRNYWGTEAADILGHSLLKYADNQGCKTVSGTSASNNRASRSLMERFGLMAIYQTKRMIKNL